jgi:hypothetical protein
MSRIIPFESRNVKLIAFKAHCNVVDEDTEIDANPRPRTNRTEATILHPL